MNRNRAISGALAGAGFTLAALSITTAPAIAQFGAPPPAAPAPQFGAPPPAAPAPTSGVLRFSRPRHEVLPWSHADSRPHVPQGRATGLFIWHDRNTVHVETTDNHWFGDTFEGRIEIKGGSFDNIKSGRDVVDTRYRQEAPNRLLFRFSAQDGDVGSFKFNIHGGSELIFHIKQNGRRTGRIYYGESETPSYRDPVVFNLKR